MRRLVGTGRMALAAALAVAALGASRAAAAAGEGPMTAQLAADLAVVRGARILFLHHSVGQNILQGIGRLDAEAGGGKLRVMGADEAVAAEGPALVETGGGRNTEPRSKIDAFAALLRASGARLRPDLAFLKLCYVDFNPHTDVDDLFKHYERTLHALEREFPGIRFAHVTVPLTPWPTELKWRVRRLAGLEVWEDSANVKRAEFNARLAAAFPGDPIFDLARVESTGPDGTATAFELGGRRYPALDPRYAADDGHLNPLGQRVAGAAALEFAAAALRSRTGAR